MTPSLRVIHVLLAVLLSIHGFDHGLVLLVRFLQLISGLFELDFVEFELLIFDGHVFEILLEPLLEVFSREGHL